MAGANTGNIQTHYTLGMTFDPEQGVALDTIDIINNHTFKDITSDLVTDKSLTFNKSNAKGVIERKMFNSYANESGPPPPPPPPPPPAGASDNSMEDSEAIQRTSESDQPHNDNLDEFGQNRKWGGRGRTKKSSKLRKNKSKRSDSRLSNTRKKTKLKNRTRK